MSSKFKKYNESSTYSKADSAVLLYCIEYELPVELELLDDTKEIVKVIGLTTYTLIVRDPKTEKDSIIYKQAIKRINIEGDANKFIEEYRKDIGSLR